jgi:hypothetical protein
MAAKKRVKISEISEGNYFKWNRVVYEKLDGNTARDTRTDKVISFYENCTVLPIDKKDTL